MYQYLIAVLVHVFQLYVQQIYTCISTLVITFCRLYCILTDKSMAHILYCCRGEVKQQAGHEEEIVYADIGELRTSRWVSARKT